MQETDCSGQSKMQMIDTVINSIIEAEEKALQIEKDAKAKSKEIIDHSLREAEEIILQTKQKIAVEIEKAEEDAERLIKIQNDAILKNAKNKALKMREENFVNMIDAKEFIIKKIIKTYGDY